MRAPGSRLTGISKPNSGDAAEWGSSLGLWRSAIDRLRKYGLIAPLAVLALAGTAAAEMPERWRAYPETGLLDRVTIRLHWFSSSKELREAARKSGREITARGLHGFSVLRRNTETGDFACDVYAVRMAGAFLDGDRTMTFGHEALHCLGLGHE